MCLEHCIYLNLQLADCDRQVENQLSHILQLALQQVNGFSLTLVLWERKSYKISIHTHTQVHITEMVWNGLTAEIHEVRRGLHVI